jgi:predicted 2-oxoglutarate/Fe(II)-dependent dioxygenase YbiX
MSSSIQVNGMFYGKLKPDATVGGCIEIFENAWPNPLETIQQIENEISKKNNSIYWERASTVNHGVYQTSRTNKMLGITYFANTVENPVCQNIHNQFNALLLSATTSYAERFKINEPLWHEPYSVLKYESGEQYKSHYDGTSSLARIISAICYLNDDYVGGEIEFINQKIKIKPEPGMLIVFPSNFAFSHIAHPIKEGTKYAMVTWLKDRNG